MPNIKHTLQPVEDIIRNKFIPALCDNRQRHDNEIILLSLPVRYGGLGIINVTSIADLEFDLSIQMTEDLKYKI